jgi:hypothetical protein
VKNKITILESFRSCPSPRAFTSQRTGQDRATVQDRTERGGCGGEGRIGGRPVALGRAAAVRGLCPLGIWGGL